jgi:hypothetical protein
MSDKMKKAIKRVAAQRPDLQKVADHLLQKQAGIGQVDDLLNQSREHGKDYIRTMKKLAIVAEGLRDLVKMAEAGRAKRSEKVSISNLKFDGKLIVADAQSQGSRDSYMTRIIVHPSRSFNCTCPDKDYRGHEKGPCKHVVALGKAFWDDHLEPELVKLDEAMVAFLLKATLLP